MDNNDLVREVLVKTPDEVQNLLLQLGENIGSQRWQIGDITNDLREAFRDIPAVAVYTAVAIMVKREVFPRTVAYYAMQAEFFTPEIREAYEPLPFSHFDAARMQGDRWRDFLDLSLGRLEKDGKIASRESLLIEFLHDPAEESIPDWDNEPGEYDPDEEMTYSVLTDLSLQISKFGRRALGLLDKLPQKDERLQTIRSLLTELIDVLEMEKT